MELTRDKLLLSDNVEVSRAFRTQFNVWSRNLFGVHRSSINSKNIQEVSDYFREWKSTGAVSK